MQTAHAHSIVERALAAAYRGGDELHEALEALPAPIYVTDADGLITFFNEACVGFAGRRPMAGKDRWCVSWRLYTLDGEALAHDRCPMATAIGEKRAVRGACAVAQRPDGTRVTFRPFPTPLLDADGELVGAINILIDVTDARQAAELRTQAARCRRLAGDLGDAQTGEALRRMAAEYDAKALGLETSPIPLIPAKAGT
jgi:PAS domain S-box-containing protein